MKQLMTVLFAAAALLAFAGDQFYWWQTPKKVSGWTQQMFDYGDPANWSLSADEYSNPDNRIPGEDDTICTDTHPDLGHPYYYYYGGFDLGGETRTIAGYSATKGAYHCTRIDLANGTFVVKNPTRANNQSRAYYVMDGATLIYPETASECSVAPGGLLEMWDIAAGGRGEIYAKIAVCGTSRDYVAYMVNEGGTMVFAPKGLNTTSSNYGTYGAVFENQGTMLIPNGVNWDGASWNNEPVGKDRMRFRQTSGTMLLGGDFKKTGRNHTLPGELTFELAGGVLEVTNSVSFYTAESAYVIESNWYEQVFASMPDGASAMVDVLANSSIDMTPFTFGAGAVLTKTGAGKMTIGANRPSTLTVYEGTLAFSGVVTDLANITFANGSTLEFSVPGNELATIENAANMTFSLGAGFVAGDTVLTTDAATAETVAANMSLPAYLSDCEVRAVDGKVTLVGVPKATITVQPFTQVAGTSPLNAGVVVTGLQRGDTLENAFSGAIVYDYGGYTVDSAPGTYVVSASGLTSEKYEIIWVPGEMTIIDAGEAATFYWKGGKEFLDFQDLANWSLSSDLQTPATRLPCGVDRIWAQNYDGGTYWYNGCYDLGGGAYTIAGFDGTGATPWKQCTVGVRNGTLTILNPSFSFAGVSQSPRYEIFAGGNVIYPYATTVSCFSPSGLQEQWLIHDGGRGEIYNYQLFCGTAANQPTVEVEEGGTFVLDPTGFGTTVSWGAYGAYFVNKGTMLLPHGVNWCHKSDNCDSSNLEKIDRVLFRQVSGTMLLGGDFCKTARNNYFIGRMTFSLEGGVLEVENTVRFYTAEAAKDPSKDWGEQVFAEMPENASATVNVRENSIFDMTIFTFGAGTALVKNGAGRLDLAAARPTSLSVTQGAVRFMSPITDWIGVTVADGVCVMFGAAGNSVDGLANAGSLRYSLAEDFPVGSTIVTASDPDVLAAVFNNLMIPPTVDGKPEIVNGKIVLKANCVVAPYPRTHVSGEPLTGNGYRIVSGPENARELISGTPVYGFGEYVEGGELGTYELTLSGLESEELSLTYLPDVLTVVDENDARTFYWKGTTSFANYWDTNNWSFASDLSDVATRLPCALDKIWSVNFEAYGWYNTGKFDLGGSAYEIDTLDATGGLNWQRYLVTLTNGTLTIRRPPNYAANGGRNQAPRYEIHAGATLIYPYGTTPTSASPSGLQERWIIHAGGRGEIYNYELFCSLADNLPFCEIEPGGTLVFDPTGFGTPPNNYGADGARLINRGTMLAPHGVRWSNNSDSSDPTTPEPIDRVRFVQQEGTMLLGGDFCKTGRNKSFIGEMVFELAGGTLEVTNSVSFYTAESAYVIASNWYEQVFAEMPADATATVDVKVDSSIDMTPFTYGAGASLTKTGPGAVTFGANLPARLTVNGGTVAFAAPTAETVPSTVTLGADFAGDFRLRVWKDGAGAVVNDVLDLEAGLSGDFTISPTCHGFSPTGDTLIRLGAYAAERELPAAKFAGRNWAFCRDANDPDSLYLRRTPAGLMMQVR